MAGNELKETVTEFCPVMSNRGVRHRMTIMENVYRVAERAFIIPIHPAPILGMSKSGNRDLAVCVDYRTRG